MHLKQEKDKKQSDSYTLFKTKIFLSSSQRDKLLIKLIKYKSEYIIKVTQTILFQ